MHNARGFYQGCRQNFFIRGVVATVQLQPVSADVVDPKVLGYERKRSVPRKWVLISRALFSI